jgi:iron complex outermembrane receptor protein
VNYTHVDSNASINPALLATAGKFAVPGIGDSGNISGYYEEGPVQLRLAYNWRGKYLSSIADPNEAGQPTTTKAYGQLDFSGSYAIGSNLSVFLTATNLLRETIFKYQVYANRPTYAEADGGTVTLGIRGSL